MLSHEETSKEILIALEAVKIDVWSIEEAHERLFDIVLGRDLKPMPKIITSDLIIAVVCNDFGVMPDDIKTLSRKQEYVTPRQICMYLCNKMTRMSLKDIGKIFNRDHSTAIYAREQTEDLMQSDRKYKDRINKIKNLILL